MNKPQPSHHSEPEDMPDWAQPEPGTAIAEPVEGEIATYGPAVQSLVEWMAETAKEGDDDTFATMERVIARMFTADSPDQVLREDLPIHGREFLDKPFTLLSFVLREGEFEEGVPFYAMLEAMLGNSGERRAISVGGWKVLAQLMVLDRMDALPQVVVIRGRETRKHRTILSLERPI